MNLTALLTTKLTLTRLFGEASIVIVALLWLGLLVGVSFLATPVKFQASLLDLPTALEVGRVTFALFSKIEWSLCSVSDHVPIIAAFFTLVFLRCPRADTSSASVLAVTDLGRSG